MKEEDHHGDSHNYPNNDSCVHISRAWRRRVCIGGAGDIHTLKQEHTRLSNSCKYCLQQHTRLNKQQLIIPETQKHQCMEQTWYGDLLRYRRGGAMLVSDSDSDRVGPWTKCYLRTTTGGSGQVGNREGLLSCLTSAER